MKFRTIATFIAVGSLLYGCDTSQPDHSALFPEWQPNLDQPIQQLEEVMAKLEQQQPMNYTISNIAFLYDAKLHILFHDFVSSLPESARASEVAVQREWLEQRKAQVHEAYSEYEGGTLASYTGGQTSIETTKERIAVIEDRMQELPTTP